MTMADAWGGPALRRWLGGVLAGAVLVAAASGVVALLESSMQQLVGRPLVYLLAVLAVATRWGLGPGVVTAVASVATFSYLFVPPRGSFSVQEVALGVSLGIFLTVAVIVAWLAAHLRRNERESGRLSQEQAGLRRVATLVAGAARPREVFAAVDDEVARLLEPDLTTLVRFEPDGSATFLAGGGWRGREMQLGHPLPVPRSLEPLRGRSVVRIDDLRERPDMSEAVEKQGVVAVVACPVVVEGRVWGAFGVGSRAGPFPAATERRLVDFTELIGTAIANAESRAEIARLLDEQGALRRVATLVARGAPPGQIFATVTDEISELLGADGAAMFRREPDGRATLMARTGDMDEMPVGSRWELDPHLVSAEVLRTGMAARRDDFDEVEGPLGPIIRRRQARSSVGIPIVVAERTWGSLTVGTTAERLPADAERRLAGFADLVGTAIANAESRAHVTRLLEVQAALHHVATLVAREATPHEVVPAVTEEIRRALDADVTLVARLDPDGQCTILAQHGPHPPELRVGRRWTPDSGLAMAEALRTGQPAVREGYSAQPLGEGTAEMIHSMGVNHALALPIVVDGKIWGVVGVARTREEPFPPDVAQRVPGFAELLATSLRNTENRTQTRRLLEEQAALRRVAMVVARGASEQEVFAAAADEVATVLEADVVMLYRIGDEDAETATLMGISGWPEGAVGRTIATNEEAVEAFRRGEPVRIDDVAVMPEAAVALAGSGVGACVVAPIILGDRLWGAVLAGSRSGPLPGGSEQRLAGFAELFGTAIANTESRAEIVRLLDEQSALRRVATVVARDAPAEEVFTAAADEVIGLLGVDVAAMYRLDGEAGEVATLMGASGWDGSRPGTAVRTDRPLIEDLRAGDTIRLDDISVAPAAAAALSGSGIRALVATSIVIEGRPWGVFGAGARGGPLPPGTEHRLASFAELVATALANTQSKTEITSLLEHQAALRRVATLVAREAPPDEVIPAVADEIGRVFGAEAMHMLRLEPDGGAMIVAQKGGHPPEMGVGNRYVLDPGLAMTEALRTGRPARRDRYDDHLGAPYAEMIGRMRLRSGVAIPILVHGQVWGTLGIATSSGPFPPGTERRLASFTELIALAIGNAESRAQVLRLLAEQGALERVATLVATGPSAAEVARAVALEIRGLLGVSDTGVCRFGPDGASVLLAGVGEHIGPWPVGMRWPLDDVDSSSEVWRTGRPARLDGDRWERAGGRVAERLRQLGVRSVVACPVTVDGRLWGTVLAWSEDTSLPADTEQRMARFTDLVAMAIGNAENQAQLAASRARIVAASDDARRRIERDLHDGAQQRIVSLGLELRLVQAGVPDELREVRDGLGRIVEELGQLLDELRETARGIHPAMLAEGGLQPALRTLARRAPVPVELDIDTDARFPEPVEVAAYYVVSEALTNAAKHAGASFVAVSLGRRDGALRLSVLDDGVGGADPQRGSGLIGLRDRVEALGGTIDVESPKGAGTRLAVRLPVVEDGPGPLTASPGR
jgi:GAF domain-containing protein